MNNIKYDKRSLEPYEHLDPLVDFLLHSGNSLSRDYRWGENRTGFFCFLTKSIDFELVRKNFTFPKYIKLNEQSDSIECDKTWVSIKGGVPKS